MSDGYEIDWRTPVRAFLLGLVVVLLLAGLVLVAGYALRAPQAQSQTPRPTGEGPEATWRPKVMVGGPVVWQACLNGDRLYLYPRTAWKGEVGPWPNDQFSVVPGGCLDSRAR